MLESVVVGSRTCACASAAHVWGAATLVESRYRQLVAEEAETSLTKVPHRTTEEPLLTATAIGASKCARFRTALKAASLA